MCAFVFTFMPIICPYFFNSRKTDNDISLYIYTNILTAVIKSMNKKIFLSILLACLTLNSFAQKEKNSLLQKAAGTAVNAIFDISEKILVSSNDSIGRDIHKRDALSTRYSRSPKKILASPDSQPLAQAIFDNKPKQLEEYLQKHKVDVNNTFIIGNYSHLGSEYEITLLEYALLAYAPNSVKILLDKGADPNRESTNSGWQYPLHIAIASSTNPLHTFNFVEDLLKAGADPNLFPSVAFAASKGKSKNIEFLLAYGAKVDVKDASGKSALFYAVERDYPEAANLLAENGADVKTVDEEGRDLPSFIQNQLDRLPKKNNTPDIWDPLQAYISRGLSYINTRKPLLKALQANGSKFYYTKNPILTPRTVEYFDVSTQQGLHSFEVSRLITNDKADELKQYLEENSLSVDMQLGQSVDYPGSTLLDHAIMADAKNTFVMLIAMNANINKESIYPNPLHAGYKIRSSPLKVTLSNPDLFYVEKLLEAGVDSSGVKVIELVRLGSSKSKNKLIQLWLDMGADIDAKDSKTGRTAIYYAIDRGDVMYATAVLLVEQGADLTVKDNNNQTPVQYLQAKLNAIDVPGNSMYLYQHSELSVLIQKIQDKGFDLYYNTEDEEPMLIRRR